MPYFPMFVNLEAKKIIVVGGGRDALKKINSLLYFGGRIAVVAPHICDEIKRINGIHICEENLSLDILDNADIVIAAARKPEVNSKIGRYCNEKNILVNVAGDTKLSSFLLPGVVVRDDLVLGITTGGNSSHVSKQVKNMLEKMMPSEYGVLVRKMAAYTELATMNIPDTNIREAALDEIVKTAVNNKCNIDDRKANKILDKYYKMVR